MIDDGSYDAFVVDANHEERGGETVLVLDVTLLAGVHKGDVLTIVGPPGSRDPLDLLGTPGTLTVRDGIPSLHLEG